LRVVLLLAALGAVAAKVDPECHMTPSQIAHEYGYHLERHWVTTDDGYILEVHRLPADSGAPVVFLQHGLLDSSITWMLNTKEGSFAFILADDGFDVWMGNVRGNTYSKNHTTLPVNSDAFWNFTFDEMAAIDLPNMIDYALNVTAEKQLFYFGHSQGSIMGFTGFSSNPALSAKIKLFTALAPVARVAHVKGGFSVMAKFQDSLEWILKEFGIRQFLPNSWIIREFATVVCPEEISFCTNIIFILAGFDRSNFNVSRVEIYESHTPAGTSTKNVIHWSQMIKANQVQMYDYESVTKNMLHYGSPYPPVYNVSALSIPTVMVMGGNDWLGDPRDELWLFQQIGHTIVKAFDIDYYNHLDFLWGEDAPKVVYYPMIKYMKSLL